MRKALLGVTLALWVAPASHAATRVIYASNWSGHTELYALGPSHNRPLSQITSWHGACPDPPYDLPVAVKPSPNGRYLAVNCGGGLWLMRINGRDARQLVATEPFRGGPGVRSRWSRDSKLLGYAVGDAVHVVEPATGRDRLATSRELSRLHWFEPGLVSPNGRWVARISTSESLVANLRSGVKLHLPGALDAAWSPDSKKLALESPNGIRVFDVRTRRVRVLTTDVGFGEAGLLYDTNTLGLAWAPDGRSIAYVMGRESHLSATWSIATGDLRVVTTKGRITTLVPAGSAYGTRMRALAWVKAANPARKMEPQAGLLAGGPVDLLAADGKRVAFETCDVIYVWTPATGESQPAAQPDLCSRRDTTGRYYFYDLALAGDRLVYALNIGCNAITISLYLRNLAGPSSENPIAQGFGNCGAPFGTAYGRAAGAGNLLVFGDWSEGHAPAIPFPVTSARVRRVDGTSCPCPTILSTPGPLYPADVDEGRAVAYGDNETIVLNRDGNRLMSIPVAPQAAQLSHDDLVVLTNGVLRDYNVPDGALLHSWRLPDVSSGPVCGWRFCETKHLVLNDARRGLVAYVLDGTLHLLRLADGADVIVRGASLGRFMDDGLVYADGARLRFVPYSQLPLLAF